MRLWPASALFFRRYASIPGRKAFYEKNFMYRILIFSMAIFGLLGCNKEGSRHFGKTGSQAVQVSQNGDSRQAFKDYWYQGKAELSRFTLMQNRYRDLHPGEAILVFVTEDFLTDKQVKNDFYKNPNSASVLKLNAIHRFATGIYDYSVMSSVFSPVQLDRYPYPFKVTNSSQDWCGQTFMQVNWQKKRFHIQWNSYFEKEADARVVQEPAYLEDGLWTQLRIDPASLPSGKIKVYPSLAYFRLMHIEVKAYPAEAKVFAYAGDEFEGEGLQVYQLYYPDLQRTLEIVFEQASPHRIAGWKETHPALGDKEMRTTLAKRTHIMLSSYWKHNGSADDGLRRELGVEGF